MTAMIVTMRMLVSYASQVNVYIPESSYRVNSLSLPFPDEDICQLENISTTLQVLEHCNDSTLLLEPSQACLHR